MIQYLLRGTCVLALCVGLTACKTSEERAEEYYQSALALIEEGDPDRAIVQLRNVFDMQGNHYDARKTLAGLLRDQGKFSEAYSQHLRLAEQYPDDLDTRLTLTGMAFAGKQWKEFDRHAEKALELAPDNPDVRAIKLTQDYRAAARAEEKDRQRQLLVDAETLLAERPDNEMLLNVLVDGAAQNEQLDRAEPLLDRLAAENPDNLTYARQKLALLVQKGDMPAVKDHLQDTLDRFPDNIEARAQMLGFYLNQGDEESAEAFLRELVAKAGEDDNGPRLDLVRFLGEQRGVDAARAELEKILAEGGDPLVFQVLLSTFDFRSGQQDKAIDEIQTLVTQSEPSARSNDVRVALSRMMLEAGRADAARQQIAAVLENNAEHPGALKVRAAWDIEADKTDDAIAALRLVLDQKPDDSEAMVVMSQAYSRAGQPDLSRDYLGQAVEASGNEPELSMRYARLLVSEERFLPAEDVVLAALRADNDNLDLLVMLGEIYLAMGDQGRTMGVIDRLREIGTDKALALSAGLDLNRIASEQGEAAALAYLEGLTAASEGNVGARLQLLRARLESGNADAALPDAEALVQENPEDRGLRAVLGMTRAAAGDLAGAEEIYQELTEKYPEDAQSYLALYRLKTRTSDTEGAAEVLNRALAKLPDNPDLLWTKAGKLEREGDIDGAISIYENLYAQNSSSVIVANNLASLLSTYHSDDPEKLERAYAISRRLNETDVPAFMDTYGWILHLRGESADGLPYLEKAAAELTGDAMVQVHLGMIQAAMGQTDAAVAQLTKAIELAGKGDTRPQIEAARQKLAELAQ